MDFSTYNTEQNIFDMASRQSRSKKNQGPEEVFLPKEQPEVVARGPFLVSIVPGEDVMEHWERCKTMYQDLDRQIDALFRNTSLTPSQLSRFLSDKKNFNQDQWKALEDVKKQNSEKFLALCQQLPVDGEQMAQKYVQMTTSHEKKSSSGMKRFGGREKKSIPKHKWLEMH